MKSLFLLMILFFSMSSLSAQVDVKQLTEPIVREGKKLYRSEMASWYGTDILVEQFKFRQEEAKGYFSYENGHLTTCIFFSKDELPQVLITISFDSTFNMRTAIINSEKRNFSVIENDIYQIRKIALEEIESDTALFKTYKNTNFNLVPFIEGDVKKVYVLTGTSKSGVVIFGNDYLLNFDKNNKLLTKKQLHKNLIPVNYSQEEDKENVGAVHSHLPETGDFITATDICTLMLYEKFAKWNQHLVISANYISIWNCKTDELVAITREAWDRIYSDQEKRKTGNEKPAKE